MKQINIIQSAKNNMERRSGILKGEIETDKGRGVSIEKKEDELAKLNDHIDAASEILMDKISELNTSHEADVIQDSTQQGEALIKGDTYAESDGTELKSENFDLPVVYTKSGVTMQPDTEAKVSLLV
jgi:hypothetical protein